MDYNFSDYTADNIKDVVEEKPFSHFVIDDFLDKDLFIKLDRDYREFYNEHGIQWDYLKTFNRVASIPAKYTMRDGKQLKINHLFGEGNHKMYSNNMPIKTYFNEQKKQDGEVLKNVDNNYSLMGANVHYNDRQFGQTIDYGGSGTMLKSFEGLCNFSETWDSFLQIIYSKEFFEYIFTIFDETPEFKNRIGKKENIRQCSDNKIEDKDKLNYFTGTKINSYTDNYGWNIHPDTTNKVLSFLLYLDNPDWPSDIKGNGTQLWEFDEEDTDFDTEEQFKYNDNSIPFQLRDGRSEEGGNLTQEQKKKIKIYKDIDYKPNRFVGFIRSDNSWHSVSPMNLPPNITRNCFQINVWSCDE